MGKSTPKKPGLSRDDAIRHLRHYHSHIQLLKKHPIIKEFGLVRLKFYWGQKKRKDARRPSDAALSSYAVIIRQFLLNDDLSSVDRLPSLYWAIGASKYRMKLLSIYRDKLNKWLNSHCGRAWGLKNPDLHVAPTNRELMELFIYGRCVHFTKRELLDRVCELEIGCDLFMNQLCYCLAAYTKFLFFIERNNMMVMESASPKPVLP